MKPTQIDLTNPKIREAFDFLISVLQKEVNHDIKTIIGLELTTKNFDPDLIKNEMKQLNFVVHEINMDIMSCMPDQNGNYICKKPHVRFL